MLTSIDAKTNTSVSQSDYYLHSVEKDTVNKAVYAGRILTNAWGIDEQNKVVLSRDREDDDLTPGAAPSQAVGGAKLALKRNLCVDLCNRQADDFRCEGDRDPLLEWRMANGIPKEVCIVSGRPQLSKKEDKREKMEKGFHVPPTTFAVFNDWWHGCQISPGIPVLWPLDSDWL